MSSLLAQSPDPCLFTLCPHLMPQYDIPQICTSTFFFPVLAFLLFLFQMLLLEHIGIVTYPLHIHRMCAWGTSIQIYVQFDLRSFPLNRGHFFAARMIKPSSARAFSKYRRIVSPLGNVHRQPLCTFYYESIVRGNPICCDWPLHSGSDLSVSSLLVMHRVTRKLWMDGPTFRQPAGGQCSLNTPLCCPTAGKQYQRGGWTWGRGFHIAPRCLGAHWESSPLCLPL